MFNNFFVFIIGEKVYSIGQYYFVYFDFMNFYNYRIFNNTGFLFSLFHINLIYYYSHVWQLILHFLTIYYEISLLFNTCFSLFYVFVIELLERISFYFFLYIVFIMFLNKTIVDLIIVSVYLFVSYYYLRVILS